MAVPKLSPENASLIAMNLTRLAKEREVIVRRGKRVIRWQDKDDFTDTPETFKTLDALYSFIIGMQALEKEAVPKIVGQDVKESLQEIASNLDSDFMYVFELITKKGFFPIPYLWQIGGDPVDVMDMAALSVELCTVVLAEKQPKLKTETKNEARNVLLKSINAIKDSATNLPGELYTWKGWGTLKKPKKAKSPRLKGSTYFTSLCCSALSKYLAALSTTPDLDLGFDRKELSTLISGGLLWIASRFNGSEKTFHKYDDDNEKALYWGTFGLIAIADANLSLDVSKQPPILDFGKQLWETLVEETNKRISATRELFETVTMLIDTPGVPAVYEDRACLGGLTLALVRCAQEFDYPHIARDFVLNWLATKVEDELQSGSALIMNNHYNLRAFLSFLEHKQPMEISVQLKIAKKTIEDVIDTKVEEMKDLLYSRLKSFEKSVQTRNGE